MNIQVLEHSLIYALNQLIVQKLASNNKWVIFPVLVTRKRGSDGLVPLAANAYTRVGAMF